MTEPLSVAFVWHMHQPYYRGSSTGPFEMPWVRMHALKDYADMVEALAGFPDLRHTFNLVPSLVEQLEAYASGDFVDQYWEHTLVPAAELGASGRAFIIDLMVERSSHPRTHRFPRYLELARKKEGCVAGGLDACAAAFSVDELRDLQVWFNLAWFDPRHLEVEPLAGLVTKGRGFSEEDKGVLAAEQQRVLAGTLTTYREAARRGQIELTTSPYYHPILPLLADSDLARVARGDIPLPTRRFSHPEDAQEQLESGLAEFARVFGERPRGLWCSEMAVGETVIPLLTQAGIEWTLGDEGTLARSLGQDIHRDAAGHVLDPAVLYSAYRLEREGRRLDIAFRDRNLADLIGFTYQSWAPADAAANLLWRLHEIRRNLEGSDEAHLVTIALDGENAWEYYERDGHHFLTALYEGLSRDDALECVTVSDFLDRHPPTRRLPWLHTGSWIYADLSTWIGDPAHTRAWDLLHDARDHVATVRAAGASGAAGRPPAAPDPIDAGTPTDGATAQRHADHEEAWRHILVAEGSDWFWWFGEHQESGIDHLWDLNFRRHLREAYRLVGSPIPEDLFTPVLAQAPVPEAVVPSGLVHPAVDGRLTWAEEWDAAGVRRVPRGGVMLPGEAHLVDEVRYGTDGERLFLLIAPGSRGFDAGVEVAVYFGAPEGSDAGSRCAQSVSAVRFAGRTRIDTEPGFELAYEALIRLEGPGQAAADLGCAGGGEEDGREPLPDVAYDQVLELAIPLASLGVSGQGRLEFVVAVGQQNVLLEIFPLRGAIDFDLAALDATRGGS